MKIIITTLALIFALKPHLTHAQTQNRFNAYDIEWVNDIIEIDSSTAKKLEKLQSEMYIDPNNSNYDVSGYGLDFWIAFADFDNDGEDELFKTIWSHPESYWVYGVFDYDNEKQIWVLNPSLVIYGEGDANSRFGEKSVGDFDGDGWIDILRETMNFHGRRGQQPDWYLENGDFTPNEIFLNRQSLFERIELDTTKMYDHFCDCDDFLNTTENGILFDLDNDGKDEAIIVYFSQIKDSAGNTYLAKRYDYEDGEIITTPYIKDDNGKYSLGIEFLSERDGYLFYNLAEAVYWNFDKNRAEVFDPSTTYSDSVVWASKLYFIKSSIADGIVLDTTKAILKLDPTFGGYLRHYVTDFNNNGIEEILINTINNEDGRKSNTFIYENGEDITNQILHDGFESLMTANATIRIGDINQDGLIDLIGDMGWGRLGQFPGDTDIPDNFMDLYKTFSEMPTYTFPEPASQLPYVPYVHLNQNGKLIPHEIVFDEEFQRFYYGTGFVPFIAPSSISASSNESPELMVTYRRTNGPGDIDEKSRSGMIFIDLKFESLITVNTEQVTTNPTEISLFQNYPNPFNPSTTIRYSLPEATQVRVEVFSLLGQSVGVLMDGVQRAGVHQISFDASDLTTGIYFYRLTTPAFTQTRQMMLIK